VAPFFCFLLYFKTEFLSGLDYSKMKLREIAEQLNYNDLKTPTGKEFKYHTCSLVQVPLIVS
jgi:hypothetical protein